MAQILKAQKLDMEYKKKQELEKKREESQTQFFLSGSLRNEALKNKCVRNENYIYKEERNNGFIDK